MSGSNTATLLKLLNRVILRIIKITSKLSKTNFKKSNFENFDILLCSLYSSLICLTADYTNPKNFTKIDQKITKNILFIRKKNNELISKTNFKKFQNKKKEQKNIEISKYEKISKAIDSLKNEIIHIDKENKELKDKISNLQKNSNNQNCLLSDGNVNKLEKPTRNNTDEEALFVKIKRNHSIIINRQRQDLDSLQSDIDQLQKQLYYVISRIETLSKWSCGVSPRQDNNIVSNYNKHYLDNKVFNRNNEKIDAKNLKIKVEQPSGIPPSYRPRVGKEKIILEPLENQEEYESNNVAPDILIKDELIDQNPDFENNTEPDKETEKIDTGTIQSNENSSRIRHPTHPIEQQHPKSELNINNFEVTSNSTNARPSSQRYQIIPTSELDIEESSTSASFSDEKSESKLDIEDYSKKSITEKYKDIIERFQFSNSILQNYSNESDDSHSYSFESFNVADRAPRRRHTIHRL